MDIPRVTPPSIHVDHDFPGMNGPERSSNRSIMNPFQRTQRPMAIPGSAAEIYAPPPLPPPKYIEEDAAGGDYGTQWRNSLDSSSFESGGSVSSRSSLRGNWDRKVAGGRATGRPDYNRRTSAVMKLPSQPEMDTRYDYSRHVDEGYHSLSGSSLVNQLHSERHLGQRHIQNSSQAYDNKLLSKIGKPKTPPHHSASSSFDAASPTSSLPFYQKGVQNGRPPHPLKSLSISEGMRGTPLESPFKPGSPFSSHGGSPRSRAISPSLVSSAASAKSYMDFRNPQWENSTPASAVDRYGPQQRHYSTPNIGQQARSHGSESVSVFANCDESAEAGEGEAQHATGGTKRGSQDQSLFSDSDSAHFPMEDAGASNTTALRQLHLEDQTSPNTTESSNLKTSGMKRGASSPPPEASRGDKVPLHSVGASNDLYQRNASSHLAANHRGSPITHYAQPQGSVSSTSSQGLRNGSYASSAAFSLVDCSMTSFSSHERHSPRGVSPSSDYPQIVKNEGPYYNQQPIPPNPQDSFPHAQQREPPDPTATTTISSQMPSNSPAQRKPSALSLQAPPHICRCCPKKPKKFDTLEELQNHQSEKQYSCNYCSNKFKNKNEAERHQNSLHLRKNSWSCATLANNYERAFHPATAILPNNANNPNSQLAATNGFADIDICGYCGLEFPNLPQPNWEDRGRHLTEVHKFGECNQSKKFFRADHFRQHLKHSHAGTSGKWTNMLEQACMKEEPVPQMISQDGMAGGQQMQQQIVGVAGPQDVGAPIANMGAMQQMQVLASRGMQPMSGMQGRTDGMHDGL